mmetsp:Transcript_53514/g.138348  ORF Transcript_53514/g.138348 Transcript_53514/m.138348 type:complete len:118 (-) Transcript_53514:364-717(-)
MYQRLSPQGFEVLAFPCNQFGGQEPGTDDEIKAFTDGYGVTFPIFAKVDVNGPNAHPLFVYLKKEKGELLGNDIKWNFAKFLVDRDGKVLARFAPPQSPESFEADVVAALNQVAVAK